MSVSDLVIEGNTVIDKIVRFYSGSYNRATQLTVYPFDITNMYAFVIPHDLGRPVFCELLFSTDGGAIWRDGGTTTKLAFSDASNIYIFDDITSGSGTVLYKVYCSWIDDYDATNPSIDTITYPDEPVQVDDALNIQKILSQTELSFSPGTFADEETISVSHNLNRTPNAKVWFEAFPNQVWPLNAGGSTNPFLVDTAQDELEMFVYADRVDAMMTKFSNLTKRAWMRIYYDED